MAVIFYFMSLIIQHLTLYLTLDFYYEDLLEFTPQSWRQAEGEMERQFWMNLEVKDLTGSPPVPLPTTPPFLCDMKRLGRVFLSEILTSCE